MAPPRPLTTIADKQARVVTADELKRRLLGRPTPPGEGSGSWAGAETSGRLPPRWKKLAQASASRAMGGPHSDVPWPKGIIRAPPPRLEVLPRCTRPGDLRAMQTQIMGVTTLNMLRHGAARHPLAAVTRHTHN